MHVNAKTRGGDRRMEPAFRKRVTARVGLLICAVVSKGGIVMNDINLLWVLGHKIRLTDTDDSYGLIEITSLPNVPGPPPHYHKAENEFFFIVRGTLDMMRDGEWSAMIAGDFVDLPPNTVHTFINNTEENVIWITGGVPKGSRSSFATLGFLLPKKAHKKNLSHRKPFKKSWRVVKDTACLRGDRDFLFQWH